MNEMDFQEATADRIVEVFKKGGQNRVLLADEVGMGKTIIARGVIQRISEWYKEQGKDYFKVIYICSNANISRQNIGKLGITDRLEVSDSRLSMQHLVIYEKRGCEHGYQQLIPLTPATSFKMTGGCGSQNERALLYAHLRRLSYFIEYQDALSQFMAYNANKYWDSDFVPKYERRVVDCDNKGGNYICEISEELKKRLKSELIDRMMNLLTGEVLAENGREVRMIINELRTVFAQISIDKLEPDLVIMDEFQRFSDLICHNDDDTDEQVMLSRRFLGNTGIKVLLLSATPYKPYSTLEEIANNGEHHYRGFLQVMNFLFYDPDKRSRFERVWNNYSMELSRMTADNLTILMACKKEAEDKMYESVCRTERFNTNIIDDSGVKPISITADDILSYVHAQKLLDYVNEKSGSSRSRSVPLDYVKSSPYLLSFMENYQLKKNITDYFERSNDCEFFSNIRKQTLLVKESDIRNYKKIKLNNARLEVLNKAVYVNDRSSIENLLWIPASRPYYKTNSLFDRNRDFSKILVFSSWEIVPRMISAMLSYEAERRTIGDLRAQKIKGWRGYFATLEEKRFGSNRLADVSKEIVCYPSMYLSALYRPCDFLGVNVSVIFRVLKEKIAEKISDIKTENNTRDGQFSVTALLGLLEALDGECSKLTVIPKNAASVLANMAIGAPGVCLYRLFGEKDMAMKVAGCFVRIFNKPESAAILDRIYINKKNDYIISVIDYCVNGNMQAMLEEFAHILNYKGSKLCDAMIESFIDTATVGIDTYESFTKTNSEPHNKVSLRTHFAVGYFNSKVSDEGLQRTENVRKAFNSPFRPFVLATTSIGQEGLDFHFYCRKIVHWNLPSNPVDLEQREGRINRFKSLAVRRNIADRYFDEQNWDKMFRKASSDLKGNYSDIVPYWCLPDNSKSSVKIERIIPMYPLSQDLPKYDRLIKVLSLYRLTLGQPRQEELIDLFRERNLSEVDRDLIIKLSPFEKKVK